MTGVDFRIIDLREIEAHRAELPRFDQVICLETIEHVLDDQGLVSSLAAMLEPGGRLLLSTPFAGHRPLYTEELAPEPVEDGSHVRYGYTPERLAELARRAGLEVADEGFISGVVAQKLTDLMRRLTDRIGLTAAWLAGAAAAPLVVFDRPLSSAARLSAPERRAVRGQARPRAGRLTPARRGDERDRARATRRRRPARSRWPTTTCS